MYVLLYYLIHTLWNVFINWIVVLHCQEQAFVSWGKKKTFQHLHMLALNEPSWTHSFFFKPLFFAPGVSPMMFPVPAMCNSKKGFIYVPDCNNTGVHLQKKKLWSNGKKNRCGFLVSPLSLCTGNFSKSGFLKKKQMFWANDTRSLETSNHNWPQHCVCFDLFTQTKKKNKKRKAGTFLIGK